MSFYFHGLVSFFKLFFLFGQDWFGAKLAGLLQSSFQFYTVEIGHGCSRYRGLPDQGLFGIDQQISQMDGLQAGPG
jgi:hypothetical protein